jgi:hypothetical protein
MILGFSLSSVKAKIPFLHRNLSNSNSQVITNSSTCPQDAYSPQAAITQLQGHIEHGLQLIREGQYEKSMEYFQNKNFLNKIRIALIYGRPQALEKIPTSQQGIKKALEMVHDKNWYYKSGSIELSELIFISKGQPVLPKTSEEQKALRQLQHEQALMFAEEHVHALQALKRQNITFFPNEPIAHADEIDIATTLAFYNVPLTEAFLRRYKRSEYIKNYIVADYS